MHNVIRRKKRNKINYASRISMDVVVMGSGYFLSAIDFVPWYMKRKAIGEISLLWQELNMAYIYKFIICRYIAPYINTPSKLSLFHQMCILLILKCMTTKEFIFLYIVVFTYTYSLFGLKHHKTYILYGYELPSNKCKFEPI